jgi:uncharacterized membrane protein
LRFFIVILLAIGIFFRFVNLDKKVYWHDETYTSLRVSGYNVEQVSRKLFNSQEISIKDLQKYQRPNPETSAIDTIKGLAKEEPQHPPLYYAIARFWAQWFGSSPTAMRSLPVLFSLLVFPCIYWLCLELFESSIVGWVAVGLIAVSPIFIRYAQEARQYLSVFICVHLWFPIMIVARDLFFCFSTYSLPAPRLPITSFPLNPGVSWNSLTLINFIFNPQQYSFFYSGLRPF